MALSKKDYVAIAEILESHPRDDRTFEIARDLAGYFQILNPRFDDMKFLEACGYSRPRYVPLDGPNHKVK